MFIHSRKVKLVDRDKVKVNVNKVKAGGKRRRVANTMVANKVVFSFPTEQSSRGTWRKLSVAWTRGWTIIHILFSGRGRLCHFSTKTCITYWARTAHKCGNV